MNKIIIILFGVMLLLGGCYSSPSVEKQPVDYVNPYMGNISHLLVPTFPTVHLPNSIMRVYPKREEYTSVLLKGLPLIVTSHRGISAFDLSPFQGDESEIKPVINYSYGQEKIMPYFYSVYLDELETEVSFAPSHQSAVYEFKFNQDKPQYITLNTEKGGLKWDGKAVSGYQFLGNGTNVYIYMETEETPAGIFKLIDGKLLSLTNSEAVSAIVLKYENNNAEKRLRYGVSFISAEQAKKNLAREISNYDVSAVSEKGKKVWNETLGKIAVEGGSDDDKTVFYTSLYRVYERPVCISEDGKYFSAFDGKVHDDGGRPFYTDDWIWDTYRAAHPLRILVDSQKEENILHSFVEMAKQMDNLWMPTFPEVTGDSRRMNCNHGVATVLDAHVKGLRGFDINTAYEACKKAIQEKSLAPWSCAPAGELDDFFNKNGYIPALRENEKETIPLLLNQHEKRQAVAVTLGTSYDYWCLAQIAAILGKTEDYEKHLKTSFNYRNLYNHQTHFFHPKDKNGKFIEPFNYILSGGKGGRDYYDENNAWTYRWDVQHNIADLISLMGGRENFVKNLDSTFSTPIGQSKFDFYFQFPDQTGNVGQFSMANEPSLHIPYLYNYAGVPWKTQKCIRMLLDQWFRNDLKGVPGDEDGGGMSAFVVFSQTGIYPVSPGMGIYNIGSPVFEKSVFKLDNGKELKIVAKDCSKENKYIQSAKLNGKEWNKPWFSNSDIKNGGVLELIMGDKPNKKWGSDPNNAPPSFEVFN